MIPADVWAACRAAWPAVEVGEDELDTYVRARVSEDELAGTRVTDLYLACALGRHDPAAVRAFESQYLLRVPPAIAHLDGGTSLVDDVIARVRARVLGPEGSKIGEYRGRGDLHGWLRVVAVREALQLLRERKRETPLSSGDEGAHGDHLAQALDAPTAPSIAEQGAYREAFSVALAALVPRERNLLRQHYLYGSTLDELATLYNVHRATIARWISQTRELLLQRTRARLGEMLRMTGTELDGVMGKLGEHLDVSLQHTLSNE